MTIDELLAITGLTASDEIPVWDAEATEEPTKKITAANLAAAMVALANLVTGVKGDSESSYRHGDVNITPANIGALPDTTPIPSKTSDLTNDSGFLTSSTGVSGVKGNAEGSYRHGDVNLTPANIGALANNGATSLCVSNKVISSNDIYGLRGIVGNTDNPTYSGADVAFSIQNNGLALYDHTNSAWIWQMIGSPESGYSGGTITAGAKCDVAYNFANKFGGIGVIAIRATVKANQTVGMSDVIATSSLLPKSTFNSVAVMITAQGSSFDGNVYPRLGSINTNGEIKQGVSSSVTEGSKIFMLFIFPAA